MRRPKPKLAGKINCNHQKPTGIPLINNVRQDRPAKRKAPTLQRVSEKLRLARQKARKLAKLRLKKRNQEQLLKKYRASIKPAKKR